ncbi:hypothetical protein ACFL9L_004349 [Salmonella enterica]
MAINTVLSRPFENSVEAGKAVQDAELYGSGWLKVSADGTLERIDPTTIVINVIPETEERK